MTNYFKGFWLSVLLHGAFLALMLVLSMRIAAKPGVKTLVDLSALVRETPPTAEQPMPHPPVKPKVSSKSRSKIAAEETRPVVSETAEAPMDETGDSFEETAPAGAIGGGGGAARYAEENYYYIQRLINKNLVYPRAAKRNGQQGKVYVGFTVEADGSVSGVHIAQSSGHSALDGSVLKAVEEAAPFPPPPTPAALVIPVEFKLL